MQKSDVFEDRIISPGADRRAFDITLPPGRKMLLGTYRVKRTGNGDSVEYLEVKIPDEEF